MSELEDSYLDERWHNTLSSVCELPTSASILIRACVIQRLRCLIPECRAHQVNGKRRIMRGDDVLLARGRWAKTGKGLSSIRPPRAKDAQSATRNSTAASASTGPPRVLVDDVVRYVLDPMYTNYTPAVNRIPEQKKRILDLLAKLVRDPEAGEEHMNRALTIFSLLFSNQKASVADIFNTLMPILLGKRQLPPGLRQRCARIVGSTCEDAAHDTLANAMRMALDQVFWSAPNYDIVRGALWGLAHHPRRLVELHNKIASAMHKCFDHFRAQEDQTAARDIMDATWTILRKEYAAHISVTIVPSLSAIRLGDDVPARRRKAARMRSLVAKISDPKKAKAAPSGAGGRGRTPLKFPGGRNESADDGQSPDAVTVIDPRITSPYIQGPLSLIAWDTYPAEMLGRADPLLCLLI